jgi:hypothetical protein
VLELNTGDDPPFPRPIPDEQARFERDVIFGMIRSLEAIKDAGYSDRQTLTSFLANPLMDQDNRTKMLKRLHGDAKLKLRLMQQQRRSEI